MELAGEETEIKQEQDCTTAGNVKHEIPFLDDLIKLEKADQTECSHSFDKNLASKAETFEMVCVKAENSDSWELHEDFSHQNDGNGDVKMEEIQSEESLKDNFTTVIQNLPSKDKTIVLNETVTKTEDGSFVEIDREDNKMLEIVIDKQIKLNKKSGLIFSNKDGQTHLKENDKTVSKHNNGYTIPKTKSNKNSVMFQLNSQQQQLKQSHNGESLLKFIDSAGEFSCSDGETSKNNYCGLEINQQSRLQEPKTTHTEEKSYTCDICGLGFTSNFNLHRHVKRHTVQKPFKCDFCGQHFARNYSLTLHKRIHTGEKLYECDVCGRKFSQNSALKVHKRGHTGEKPYKCDICGEKFSVNKKLIIHIRTHTGEKPFKCDFCDRRFSHSDALKSHKTKHTDEKPYKCDICGKGFSLNYNLKIHTRTHTGERPFKCDVCGWQFLQTGHLAKHKTTHTGEKPYKCDVCDSQFSCKSYLQRHKTTHEKLYMYKKCAAKSPEYPQKEETSQR